MANNQNEIEVYKKIYDIVASNLKANNMTFGYCCETFIKDIGIHPVCIDVQRYLDLGNKEFFQAIYVSVFKRLPDEREYKAWSEHFEEEPDEFKQKLLKAVENSTVVGINQMEFVNNPYFDQHKGLKYKMLGKLYGLTDKSNLREFGKKMPMPIQKVIRKVFL